MGNGRKVSEEDWGKHSNVVHKGDVLVWCARARGVPCQRPLGGGASLCGHQHLGAGHAGAVSSPLSHPFSCQPFLLLSLQLLGGTA